MMGCARTEKASVRTPASTPNLSLILQKPDATSEPPVFTGVTVIDATGAPAKPDMTVVITGDRNTQKIRAVVFAGRLYDRKALDEMLAQVEALANKK